MSWLESLPASQLKDQPLLYMNGWDLFEAHPDLWEESLGELPGTIRNLSIAAYQTMHKRVRTPGLGWTHPAPYEPTRTARCSQTPLTGQLCHWYPHLCLYALEPIPAVSVGR